MFIHTDNMGNKIIFLHLHVIVNLQATCGEGDI